MSVRVLKFGGAALRDGPATLRAASVIREHGGGAPLVVVSAHEGVTRTLEELAAAAARGEPPSDAVRIRHRTILRQLELASELLDRYFAQLETVLRAVRAARRLERRQRDFIVSLGERMSARVVAALLRRSGVPATPVDAFDLGLLSQTRDGLTLPLESAKERVREAVLAVPGLPVVTGFIALDEEGHVTTLGRNGSDLTAVWIGEAVGAAEVHLWKTVDGVHTADPRLVPSARRLARLDYTSASELALHGADVLHPAAMEPALRSGMPILVRGMDDPSSPGTRIGPEGADSRAARGPIAVAHRARVALVARRPAERRSAAEELARLCASCRDAGLEPCAAVANGAAAEVVLPDGGPAADGALAAIARDARLERGLAAFSLVGPGVGAEPALAGAVVELARSIGSEARALRTDGERSLLFLTPAPELAPLLRRVHDAFVLAREPLPGAAAAERTPAGDRV